MKNRKNTWGTAESFPGCPEEADTKADTVAGNTYPFNFTEIYVNGNTVAAGPAQPGGSVITRPASADDF